MPEVSAQWNPYQQWQNGTAQGTGGAQGLVDQYGNIQTNAKTLSQVGSAAPEVGGNAFQNEVGNGAGQIFSQAREAQAVNVLNAGLSSNEGDVGLRDMARNALAKQYSQFNPDAQNNNLNSQYDTGLNNSLAIARRQMGGTGTFGSTQGNAGLGDIIAKSNTARMNDQAGLQAQQAQTLGQLGNNETNTLNQSLAERGYNLKQAEDLSSLLESQSNAQNQWLLGNRDAPQAPFTLQQGLGDLIGAGGVAAKAFAKAA